MRVHIAISKYALSGIFILGCVNIPPPSVTEKSSQQDKRIPKYKIVDENVYDAPVKTQVEQHILVLDTLTENNLRTLLLQRYDSIMKRKGFRYHDSPTNVYIYAYDSEEKAKLGQGLWIAMLEKSFRNDKPNITVRGEQIKKIGKEPEEKFGLSETKRMQIFKEIIRAEDRATAEAESRYPSDILKQIDLEAELKENYKDELAKKYGLTRDDLKNIGVEGIVNHWPTK